MSGVHNGEDVIPNDRLYGEAHTSPDDRITRHLHHRPFYNEAAQLGPFAQQVKHGSIVLSILWGHF